MSKALPTDVPNSRSGGHLKRPGDGLAGASSGMDGARATVVFLLSVLRRWGILCLPLGLLSAGAAVYFIWGLPRPVYLATGWIRIEDKRPTITSAETDSKKFAQTQVQLITCPLVVNQALKQPAVTKLPQVQKSTSALDWVTKHVQVTPAGTAPGPISTAPTGPPKPNTSEIYNVQFDDSDPKVAATMVNAVVSAYMNLYSDSDSKQTRELLKLLEQEKERRATDMHRLQENVRALTKAVSSKDPLTARNTRGSPLILNTTSSDEDRLAATEVERQMLEVKLRSYEESVAKKHVEVSAAQIDAAISARPEVMQQDAAIDKAKARLARTIEVLAKGNDDPRARTAEQEVAKLESGLKQLREKLRSEVTQRAEETELAKRQEALVGLREAIANKRGLEELFKRRHQKWLREQENISGQALELENARLELTRTETVYQSICDRATRLQTEMRAPMQVSLLERAVPPTKPVKDYRILVAMAATLAGLGWPFGLATFWEICVRRVVESRQVETATGIPVIGEIAALPTKRWFNRNVKFQRRQRIYEESIDALRTSLVMSDDMKDVRIIAVTSAVSAEGKTSLASQLAVSLARASGEQTLLIDGNMRTPDLHAVFEVTNERGLADVLGGRCAPQEAIVTDWHKDLKLHLMPAGHLERSPYVLLGDGRLSSVLEELRNVYRYIVIDAPSVLSAGEALIINKSADGTILCTLRERTRVPRLTLARQRLQSVGVRLLGAVLAGVPARSYANKYGGYCCYGNRPNGGTKSGGKNRDPIKKIA
jgi:polysaccharide biosynthesis transport protein